MAKPKEHKKLFAELNALEKSTHEMRHDSHHDLRIFLDKKNLSTVFAYFMMLAFLLNSDIGLQNICTIFSTIEIKVYGNKNAVYFCFIGRLDDLWNA